MAVDACIRPYGACIGAIDSEEWDESDRPSSSQGTRLSDTTIAIRLCAFGADRANELQPDVRLHGIRLRVFLSPSWPRREWGSGGRRVQSDTTELDGWCWRLHCTSVTMGYVILKMYVSCKRSNRRVCPPRRCVQSDISALSQSYRRMRYSH